MKKQKRSNEELIYYGFNEQFNITDVFLIGKKYFLDKNFLITCLDSTKDWRKLSKWIEYLKENKFNYSFLSKAIIITGDYAAHLFIDGKTFYHFDEVYLFKKNDIPGDSLKHTYTSDGYEFRETLPKDFLSYFIKSQAETYLSDGCGLNFVTLSRNLAKKLSLKKVKTMIIEKQ